MGVRNVCAREDSPSVCLVQLKLLAPRSPIKHRRNLAVFANPIAVQTEVDVIRQRKTMLKHRFLRCASEGHGPA
jgi:hypothetical protein